MRSPPLVRFQNLYEKIQRFFRENALSDLRSFIRVSRFTEPSQLFSSLFHLLSVPVRIRIERLAGTFDVADLFFFGHRFESSSSVRERCVVLRLSKGAAPAPSRVRAKRIVGLQAAPRADPVLYERYAFSVRDRLHGGFGASKSLGDGRSALLRVLFQVRDLPSCPSTAYCSSSELRSTHSFRNGR